MDAIVRYAWAMAVRDRPTQSYAQVPFANEADRAAWATARRAESKRIDACVTIAVGRIVNADRHKWACARATDLVGEAVRLRAGLTDRDDPA
jgi:hypothetical protein